MRNARTHASQLFSLQPGSDRMLTCVVFWPRDHGLSGDLVKLTDFGFATVSKGGNTLQTTCGTPEYVSPETLRQECVLLMMTLFQGSPTAL